MQELTGLSLCDVINIMYYYRFVGTFISRKDRLKDMGHNTRFTNLYVKNFVDLDDAGLRDMFSKFGKIVSAVVMKDKNNINKALGYGFVSFEDHASANNVSCHGDAELVLNVLQPLSISLSLGHTIPAQ